MFFFDPEYWLRVWTIFCLPQSRAAEKAPEVKRKRFEDGGPCKGVRLKL